MPPSIDAALAALGMPVPDSAFARRVRELIESDEPEFLVNHSVRSYAWAVALARIDRLVFDPEILYVSAVLHDIGLVPTFDAGGCFEIDGAVAAERRAIEAGWPTPRARAVYYAIALHMALELPTDAAPEATLLFDSTGVDVTGYRHDEVPAELVVDVIAAYPRLDFKRGFGRLFADQATRKPACRAATMVAAGLLGRMESAPFAS